MASTYHDYIKKLHAEAQQRVSFVGKDNLGDAVLYRDIGRFMPMLLSAAFEVAVGSTDPEDAVSLKHYDTFYRSYLLLHNGALTDRRDHVSVLEDIYAYVEAENAGHQFAVYNAAVVQAMCCMLYTSAAVMSGMVEQQPEGIFAHILAQNIIARAPTEIRAAAVKHAQSEGIYPSNTMTAVLSSKLQGVREMIEEDQRMIVERLQSLRRAEEAAKEVDNGSN